MSLTSQLEVVLFVASKPLTVKKMSETLGVPADEIILLLERLREKYGVESGIQLVHVGEEWQLVTCPEERLLAERFMKAEISGELTKPQLETLTVVAYCGPITRPELEQIRGVNCALILRNLEMRGLIQEIDSLTALVPTYSITIDYMRALGITTVEELPNYQELHRHEYVMRALDSLGTQEERGGPSGDNSVHSSVSREDVQDNTSM